MTDAILHPEDIELFRAEALAMMTDTCRITVPNPAAAALVLDENTGRYSTPSGARRVIYEGPCRFQVKADINSNVVQTTSGEREWTYLTAQLQLPMDTSGDIPVGAIAECLTAAYDVAMPGRLFNIQGTYHKSQSVIRRFRVREVVA